MSDAPQSAPLETEVAAHYGKAGLLETILDGLAKAGADLDNLRPEDLAPVDEFHTAGRATTLKALEHFPVTANAHVLDAGAGLGGTARCLAVERGCTVTGLDLTRDYVATARALTERMGLSDRCAFIEGSALDMPFEDDSFDAGVSFHAAMNIADRPRLYGELARVLRPGSPLCLFDVMKGPAEGMLFPVPWAETEATSFLRSREETRALLDDAGFDTVVEENLRDFSIAYFKDAFARASASDGPPPLGLHLLTGANAPEKFSNYAAMLDAHQIEPVILAARRR